MDWKTSNFAKLRRRQVTPLWRSEFSLKIGGYRNCVRDCDYESNGKWKHHELMVASSNRSSVPDLSASLRRETSSSSPPESSPPATIRETQTAVLPRHVLPGDLDVAIRYLDDQELDRLVSAALEERARRKPPAGLNETQRRKRDPEAVAVSLPQGKLNAIRAAFKAGVTPSRIAREFGISQQDVRGALKGDARKQ